MTCSRSAEQDPGDDLISALITVNDEEPERLSDTELLNNIVFMFGAGHETATGMLGNGLRAMLTYRDQWELLCADTSRAPGAVSEIVRWDPPVQYFSRKVLGDLDIAGKTLKQGEVVMGLIGSANRDPRRFPDPDHVRHHPAGPAGPVVRWRHPLLHRRDARQGRGGGRVPGAGGAVSGISLDGSAERRRMLAIRGYRRLGVRV